MNNILFLTLENVSPEISGAPGRLIFSLIWPYAFMTLIKPSSERLLNSYLATYNKSEGLTTHAIGPNLPEKLMYTLK